MDKKKILHFEDEDYIASMYETLLRQKGADYVHYLTPPPEEEELIKLVLEEKPDLILMDVLMPHMNGFKATEILKNCEETRAIPIFGMSNMFQGEEIKKALACGMVDFIGKVFLRPSEIVNTVVEFLEKGEEYIPKCYDFIGN